MMVADTNGAKLPVDMVISNKANAQGPFRAVMYHMPCATDDAYAQLYMRVRMNSHP